MGIVHYLNVKNGDCSIIEHASGNKSVIDVCNARKLEDYSENQASIHQFRKITGNFNQKAYPVNPIQYMKDRNIDNIFRFILTHPDMDHMDGIKDLFETIPVINFWDTDNEKEVSFEEGSPYRQEDWDFYKNIRDGKVSEPKRLALLDGSRAQYFNVDNNGNSGGDGLYILSPSQKLIDESIEQDDYNDSSYVVLYRSAGGKILFTGDCHNKSWEHILENYEDEVRDIDLLIAPHHGRRSDGNFDYLDVLNPKLTFFGNADSEHLAYEQWNRRGLPIITNNQANCMVVNSENGLMHLYVTNKIFAEKLNANTFYSESLRAYYCFEIHSWSLSNKAAA